MSQTRTLTIECTPALARTIVELLLTEPGAFNIAVSESAPHNGTKPRAKQGQPSPTNKGLKAILTVGLRATSFQIAAAEEACRAEGLATVSTSPALSHAKTDGYVNKDGKTYTLTEKGRKLAASWGLDA